VVLDTLIELGFGPERPCPSIDALTQLVGVGRQSVMSWLSGTHSPRVDQAERLARALGVSLVVLIHAIANAKRRREKAAEVQAVLNQTH
jgi:transcriptional regulator with XRE-family HTH domain